MGKTLIITEKPSVAMEYASVLGVKGRKNGYLENEEYLITWCVGHLIAMSYPEKYDEKYKKWNLEELPFLPKDYKYEIIPSVKEQYEIVHKLMNSDEISRILYCGDSGREGELIGRLIRDYGGVKKGVEERRVWIDSFTKEEILRGIRESKPLSCYDNVAAAGIVRSIEDFAIGINFSRALSCKYGNFFRSQSKSETKRGIAVGRVMTCVLGMIVEREREIRNFKQTEYYRIYSILDNSGIVAEWKLTDKSSLKGNKNLYEEKGILQESLADSFMTGLPEQVMISKLEKKTEKKYAPFLFNLTELQSECTKCFKVSPAETLAAAQSLYEKKLTTYPRTDARVLSSPVAKVIEKTIEGLKQYKEAVKYCEEILHAGWQEQISKTKYTDDSKISDHYAIIPTGQGFEKLGELTELEKKIYELIVRRFLSIFYPPAEYYKIQLKETAGQELFAASAKMLKTAGYLSVAGLAEEDKEKTDKVDMLEGLAEGDILSVSYKKEKSHTSAPPRYTSGSMVLAMENAGNLIEDEELRAQIKGSGIGTPATRAEIITKLVKIEYISLNTKTQILTPHPDGEVVYDIVMKTLPELLLPKMTAEWERGLSEIEKGELSREAYEEQLYQYIRRQISAIKEKNGWQNYTEVSNENTEEEVLGNCPLCGKTVKENSKSFYCSGYKDGCRWSVWKNDKYFAAIGKKITKTLVKNLLENGQIQVKDLKSRNGNSYSITLKYVKNDKGYLSWEKV
ncbi:DNA topoisomerase [Lachnospiraceae bacterium 48-33]